MRKTSLIIILCVLPWSAAADARQRQQPQDTVPELAGAERVTGSILVDGHLPAPYLDYVIVMSPNHSQKLSIYQNGLVTMTTTIEDRQSMKKVLFPPGAIETYRPHLSVEILENSNKQPLIATPTRLRETIRIYDDEGRPVTRTYDPSLYLPSGLENMRSLLQDLARILIEDNEITNPMTDYEPESGDLLLDQQMQSWTVKRVVNDHVEVQADNSPLRAWVKADQLDEQFMSWSRSSSPAE